MEAPLRFASPDLSRVADGAGLTALRDCALCGRRQFEPLEELAGFQFFTDDPGAGKRVDLRIVECRSCGLLHLNPGYTRRGAGVLFAEAGHSFGAGPARYDARAAWLCERALPVAGETVLDLGCHEGDLLARFPGTLRRVGLDGDAASLARGRERHEGIELREVDLEAEESGPALAEVAAEADVIALFHVLEHLSGPLPLLRRLRAGAKAGARLVVEVPVLDGAEHGDVVGFFTPHHQTHFDREGLLAMLATGGWVVREEEPSGDGALRVLALPGEGAEPPARTGHSLSYLRNGPRMGLGRIQAYRRLADVVGDRCVLWGAGNHTEMLLHRTDWLDVRGARPLALVDSDPAKQGRTWRGVPIHAPEALRSADWSDTWLVVSSYRGMPAIARAALGQGVPAACIVRLYDQEGA